MKEKKSKYKFLLVAFAIYTVYILIMMLKLELDPSATCINKLTQDKFLHSSNESDISQFTFFSFFLFICVMKRESVIIACTLLVINICFEGFSLICFAKGSSPALLHISMFSLQTSLPNVLAPS